MARQPTPNDRPAMGHEQPSPPPGRHDHRPGLRSDNYHASAPPALESEAAAACVIDQFDYIEQRGLVRSHAWVVMPDHVHWMFELRAAHLPDIARRMKSSSALALNRLAGRRSTVWQPGYFDHAVRAEESMARQALYILGIRYAPVLLGRLASIRMRGRRMPASGRHYQSMFSAAIRCSAPLECASAVVGRFDAGQRPAVPRQNRSAAQIVFRRTAHPRWCAGRWPATP